MFYKHQLWLQQFLRGVNIEKIYSNGLNFAGNSEMSMWSQGEESNVFHGRTTRCRRLSKVG